MVDVVRQLPEIKEFFSKWYPSYARLADHDRVMGLVESGDEQGLIDLLYDSSWERVKHKLDNSGRIAFKREFDQMLDAIFPGRASERVDDPPIMAGLRKKAGVTYPEAKQEYQELVDSYLQEHANEFESEHWKLFQDGFYEQIPEDLLVNELPLSLGNKAIDETWGIAIKRLRGLDDPDATIYHEPTKKHDVKTQPYAPGHKSPADRRKEMEEAYRMLHGKSRFTLYRNKDRAIRTNRVHVRKRLLTPRACSWCSMLSPEKSVNLVKVAMNSHSVCKRCTSKMLEEINGRSL